MKIKNLDKYINKADNSSHWIDHLRLNLKEEISFLSEVLNKIEDDNLNQEIQQIEGYSFSMLKFRTNNWYALNISLFVDDVPYTIRQYLEYNEKSKKLLRSKWSFTYYSTYFRLTEMGLIEASFDKIIFKKEMFSLYLATISRMDYRIDFFYKEKTDIIPMKNIVEYESNYSSEKYFLDKGTYEQHQDLLFRRMLQNKPIHYDSKIFYSKWDFQNSWRIGNKKNKSIFIRCYEKIVESTEDWKVMLYDDYFNYSNVFRLEIEFLAKFNKKKNWSFFVFSEISELEAKIHRFFGLSDKIEGEKFLYQYKTNKETDFSKLRRQKDFWGRWYSIYQQGFNPFIVLYKVIRTKVINTTKFNKIITVFKDYMSRREEEMDEEYRPQSWKIKTKFYN